MGKKRKKYKGAHTYDEYDYDLVAEKCSVCGLLRKMGATREAHRKQSLYFVDGQWVTRSPKCKN